MKDELIKYCKADAEILRQGCIKVKYFLTANKVDTLLECITIASACNLVYRRNFLTPERIGIIPRSVYRMTDIQSAMAIKWLMWEAH